MNLHISYTIMNKRMKSNISGIFLLHLDLDGKNIISNTVGHLDSSLLYIFATGMLMIFVFIYIS